MRQVTKEAFFAAMGPLDVHPHIRPGPWPYVSDWKLRHSGQIVGKSEAIRNPKIGEDYETYFLQEGIS